MRWGQNTEQEFQQSTDKKVELQQDEHFEVSEFHIMGWGHYKRNNTDLKHVMILLSSKGSIKTKKDQI